MNGAGRGKINMSGPLMHPDSTVTAAGLILALAAGTQRAIEQVTPLAARISIDEVGAAAVGGCVGGWLLASVVRPADRLDAVASVLLSSGLGAVLGPALARWSEMRVSGLDVGDPLVAAFAGAGVGMVIPPIFAVFVALCATARANPASIGDFLRKFFGREK